MRAWRWPVRLVLPAALVAGLIVDDRIDRSDGLDSLEAEVNTELVVPDASALSSTWFCPAVYLSRVGELGVEATAQIVITNTTTDRTRARVELLSATSAPRVVEVDVDGLRSATVAIEPGATDDLIAALVESPSGGVMVTRDLSSPLGADSARCSTSPSDRWFVPAGDTQRDATNELVLFNPLPSDAVIDMSFSTEAETGAYVAVDLEGLVVPPQTPVRVNLGEHVRRRDVVATTIEVRAGRVVVDQFQTYDGSAGRMGFSAELATSTVAERWLLPSGRVDADSWLEVRVMNPSDEVAEVDLAGVSADAGGDPVAITVGPREIAAVHVRPFLDSAPVLPTVEVVSGAEFGLVVESANGVGLVVGVELGAGPAGAPADDLDVPDEESSSEPVADDEPVDQESGLAEGAVNQDSRRSAAGGITLLPAMPRPAESWLLIVPGNEGVVSRLVVQTPSSETRMVQIHEVGGALRSEFELVGAQVEVVEVAAGSALVVRADGPVVVSLLQELIDGLGLAGVLPIEF